MLVQRNIRKTVNMNTPYTLDLQQDLPDIEPATILFDLVNAQRITVTSDRKWAIVRLWEKLHNMTSARYTLVAYTYQYRYTRTVTKLGEIREEILATPKLRTATSTMKFYYINGEVFRVVRNNPHSEYYMSPAASKNQRICPEPWVSEAHKVLHLVRDEVFD